MRTKMNHQRVAAAVMLGLLLSFLPGMGVSQETITPQGAVIVQPPEPSSDDLERRGRAMRNRPKHESVRRRDPRTPS